MRFNTPENVLVFVFEDTHKIYGYIAVRLQEGLNVQKLALFGIIFYKISLKNT
jgi:hypothetical protein